MSAASASLSGVEQLCGGTLVDRSGWVLTAAHCVKGLDTRKLELSLYTGNWGRISYRPALVLVNPRYKGRFAVTQVKPDGLVSYS